MHRGPHFVIGRFAYREVLPDPAPAHLGHFGPSTRDSAVKYRYEVVIHVTFWP